MERFSLPGEWAKVNFISSDATPNVIAGIDWTTGLVFRVKVNDLRPWVQKVLTDIERIEEDERLAIHLGEMLSFVAFSCQVADAWRGAIVVYRDNVVVKRWLQRRVSNTRAGRLLIRLTNMIEARYGCAILAGWWTKNK